MWPEVSSLGHPCVMQLLGRIGHRQQLESHLCVHRSMRCVCLCDLLWQEWMSSAIDHPQWHASSHPSPTPALLAVQGGDFVIGSYMRPMSAISMLPRSAASLVHVDDFSIDYRPDGSVAQVG